ncbi:hypothetical protein ACHAXT_009839 [Thalassiosira profunda]
MAPTARGTRRGSSKESTPKRRKVSSGDKRSTAEMPPLLHLGKLVRGTLVKRPSAAIKSPYVADVALLNGKKKASAETVLAHAPALDVGGMCVPGSEVCLSRRPPGGKTSHSIELGRGAPLAATGPGVLVGVHPRLGESVAEEVLRRGLLRDALSLPKGLELGPVNGGATKSGSPKKAETDDESSINNNTNTTTIDLRRQVTLGDSRVDFQMTLSRNAPMSKTHTIIWEVKNVVCADYEAGTEPAITGPGHCVVVAPSSTKTKGKGKGGYQRAALFPWGRTRGQTFEGSKVVSERACKHLRNLQALRSKDVTPVVLFVVNRADCESVRACHERCPVFAEVLAEAVKGGVKALAVRVRWTEGGECHFDGVIPVTV